MVMKERFAEHLTIRPKTSGIDIVSTLRHFAIITYTVDVERLAALLPARFEPTTVTLDGQTHGLLSVVPFLDDDFTFTNIPFPKLQMGQTNYRAYVRDRESGELAVWFFGTSLDSWTNVVPHRLWRLPWHAGRIRFDCELDEATGLYRSYAMETASKWAPARVRLSQAAEMASQPHNLAGFPDDETGLVVLTHPLTGYYYRRDGKLGSYHIWHDRLALKPASLVSAEFGLLERLGLVSQAEQQTPHSVLLMPETVFTIYLPPVVVN